MEPVGQNGQQIIIFTCCDGDRQPFSCDWLDCEGLQEGLAQPPDRQGFELGGWDKAQRLFFSSFFVYGYMAFTQEVQKRILDLLELKL